MKGENLKVSINGFEVYFEAMPKYYYIRIKPGMFGQKYSVFFENRREDAMKKFESLKNYARA